MGNPRDVRRRVRHMIGPIITALLVAYFGFHAVTGERSMLSWWRLGQQIENAHITLASVRTERERLEHRVSLMRPEHLDPDLLDERARWTLNLLHPDEFLILEATSPE